MCTSGIQGNWQPAKTNSFFFSLFLGLSVYVWVCVFCFSNYAYITNAEIGWTAKKTTPKQTPMNIFFFSSSSFSSHWITILFFFFFFFNCCCCRMLLFNQLALFSFRCYYNGYILFASMINSRSICLAKQSDTNRRSLDDYDVVDDTLWTLGKLDPSSPENPYARTILQKTQNQCYFLLGKMYREYSDRLMSSILKPQTCTQSQLDFTSIWTEQKHYTRTCVRTSLSH